VSWVTRDRDDDSQLIFSKKIPTAVEYPVTPCVEVQKGTMGRSIWIVILAVLALVFETSTAFSTASSKMTFQPARIIPGARVVAASRRQASQILMSGETTTESTDEAAAKKPMPTSGTYYDDEVRLAAC
jgi:hypothetical protein